MKAMKSGIAALLILTLSPGCAAYRVEYTVSVQTDVHYQTEGMSGPANTVGKVEAKLVREPQLRTAAKPVPPTSPVAAPAASEQKK